MSTIVSEFKIHHINGALGPFNVNVNVKISANEDKIVKFEISSNSINDESLNIKSLNDFHSLISVLREVDSELVKIIKDY